MVILGIDPGSRRMGYGLVRKTGARVEFLAAGLVPIQSATDPAALQEAAAGMRELCRKWQPELVAIEKLYFAKNRRTGLAVAQARGAILTVCAEHNLLIEEYTPREIKLGLAGNGGADKRAVLKMVRLILNKPDLKLIDDASDALGIALYAGQRFRY